jgi:tRNA(Ile)-lysidine synthase
MIRLAVNNFPQHITVALSGGPDSMCLLDFLLKSKSKVSAIHFNHGTENADSYQAFVTEYCAKRGVRLEIVKLDFNTEHGWSRARKEKFLSMKTIIATGHNLNDAVETWMMTSMRGLGRLLPPVSDNTIRPLLITNKDKILDWNKRKGVPFVIDNTNVGDYNDRARIRAVMPDLLKIHPGLFTTIKNKLTDEFDIIDCIGYAKFIGLEVSRADRSTVSNSQNT